MSQIHKKFKDNEVKDLINRYLRKEIKRKYIQEILGIGQTRFFALIKKYRAGPDSFSVQYERKTHPRKISPEIEENIIKELTIEKQMIQNKEIPLKSYNYSYIREILMNKYSQKVALSTIINKAKKNDFYLKKPKKSIHDREVITNYIGQLIQHDSSYHLWAPDAKEKWYLITSLDDYSRFILYAKLIKKETSWSHIIAIQTVFLKYGLPLSYYVDSHSIFRFVRGRDSFWRKHHKLTDEAIPQWKQVLNDCNVDVSHALSPQAKGKIERPYGWLQDRLVRSCVRENVNDIKDAQTLLDQQIKRYNYRQLHSTTLQVPHFRFKEAQENNKSLFRTFKIKPPFKSIKDIFCLRIDRIADAYRKISLNNLKLKANRLNPRDYVNLRIYPLNKQISEIRFWVKGQLIDIQKIKNSDLKGLFTFKS
jgi:hypothetical protein